MLRSLYEISCYGYMYKWMFRLTLKYRIVFVAIHFITYLCFGDNPIPYARDETVFVHVDTEKEIQLDARIPIPDGGEVLLNVQVPQERIAIDPNGPAKVVSVYSDHINGTFGVGEEIYIYVVFTRAIHVIGSPTLLLHTGCHSRSCDISEIQRLQCRATRGKFAVKLGKYYIANIPFNARPELLASYIEQMPPIHSVHIEYLDGDSACSYFGNNITITFNQVNLIGESGDIPELLTDHENVLGDGEKLQHVRWDVQLSSLAIELRKGVKIPDREATFIGQNAENNLKFVYIVQSGDKTERLDYTNTDSLLRSIVNTKSTDQTSVKITNAGTTVDVNARLPPPGSSGDWRKGIGTSLSFNTRLEINTESPYILKVTSPNLDGTYGVGERISIHVYFSQPITTIGTVTLLLETGATDRQAHLVGLLPLNQGLDLMYVVQPRDKSAALNYAHSNTLQVLQGKVLRYSSNPSMAANLTLPYPGLYASLSGNKNIVIDTSPPSVIQVRAQSRNGAYTAGDIVLIDVIFDAPVSVTGEPLLLLETGSVDLYPGYFVVEAPVANNRYAIRFPHVEHLLTTKSRGLQFQIDGMIYTIESVEGDIVTMIEEYKGRWVNAAGISGPYIPIMTPGVRAASFMGGADSTILTYEYIVQIGDVSSDLTYTSSSALVLQGGSIKRTSTEPQTHANSNLPPPGAPRSLSYLSDILISTDAPIIKNVNLLTRDGIYTTNDVITFEVVFNYPVIVYTEASVYFGENDRYATYAKGNGTDSLEFNFLCQDSDNIDVFDLTHSSTEVRASFGSQFGKIARKSDNPIIIAKLGLPATGFSSKGVSVNPTTPIILSIWTSHERSIVGAGEIIIINIEYSAPVLVDISNGIPILRIVTGKTASYTSGTGTPVVEFTYIVALDDPLTHLTYIDRYSLEMNGGSILESSTGKKVTFMLPVPGTTILQTKNNIIIDTSPPVVQNVKIRSPNNSVFTVGDTVMIEVKFSSPISVDNQSGSGIPTILLEVGTHDAIKVVYYESIYDRLFFKYVIQPGHSTSSLSYTSRRALYCAKSYGFNIDPNNNAVMPAAVEFENLVFFAWTEYSESSSKIYVQSLQFSDTPPFPILGDGQVESSPNFQFDPTANGRNPFLAVFNARLYCIWEETLANDVITVIIAVYLGKQETLQWKLVDKASDIDRGLNYNPSMKASKPSLIVHNGSLYASWYEESPALITSARIAKYNGNDEAPLWTFLESFPSKVDAINAQKNIYLSSCDSKLYAVWEETTENSNVSNIYVAKFDSTMKVWKYIHGNNGLSINENVCLSAASPSITCVNNQVVIGWHGITLGNDVTTKVYVLRLRKFDAQTSWELLCNANGMEGQDLISRTNIKVYNHKTSFGEILYATWSENYLDNTYAYNVRVARLVRDDSQLFDRYIGYENWVYSSVYDDNTHVVSNAVAFNLDLKLYNSDYFPAHFIFWEELNENTQTMHIRGAMSQIESNFVLSVWRSFNDHCIRRDSSVPTTIANLLLPRKNDGGSLDWQTNYQINSAEPAIINVTAVGDIPSWSSVSRNQQTIDIFNYSRIMQGEYQLMYAEKTSSCINWSAPATGPDSVEMAIRSISGLVLDVVVTEDLTVFGDGIRYTVLFNFPMYGIQNLQVVDTRHQGSGCIPFICTMEGQSIPCFENEFVIINGNLQLPTSSGGIIDLAVEFDTPIIVYTGTPTLNLLTGIGSHNDAIYTKRGAVQQFDVGVSAPSPYLKASYIVEYRSATTGVIIGSTGCITTVGMDSNSEAAELLRSKLLEIPEIRTIGISQISRKGVGNGFRYSVTFRNSGDLQDLVAGYSPHVCIPYSGIVQTIDIHSKSAILQGEFKLKFGSHQSACIPWDTEAVQSTLSRPSMQEILSSILPHRLVPITVTKIPLITKHGSRYILEYLRMDDAQSAIEAFADPNCISFICDDGAGGTGPCIDLALQINADFNVHESNSETLLFQYILHPTDSTKSLACSGKAALNGDIMRFSTIPTIKAKLDLPESSISTIVDSNQNKPITLVSSTMNAHVITVNFASGDGVYTVGDALVILVIFSNTVFVDGSPLIELNSNGKAIYVKGSGSNVLEFNYKVSFEDSTSSLDYISPSSLLFPSQKSRIYTIDSFMGIIDINPKLPEVGIASLSSNSHISIDTTVPTIVSITSPSSDSAEGDIGYGIGDFILISVVFSKEVAVAKVETVPMLKLTSGGTAHLSLEGYRQILDVAVHSERPGVTGQFAVHYDGVISGCIDYPDPSSFELRLLELEKIKNIGVKSVSVLPFRNGHRYVIVFDDQKSRIVPSAISPIITSNCRPLLPPCNPPELMLLRANDETLTFGYVVHEGEHALDLDIDDANTYLGLATAIRRFAKFPTLHANVRLPDVLSPQRLVNLKNLKVSGQRTVVNDIITESIGGTYGVGYPTTASPSKILPGEILFHVLFSRPVYVVGLPSVELQTGSVLSNRETIPNRLATYYGQSEPTIVSFLYHIEEEDMSSNLEFTDIHGLMKSQIYSVTNRNAPVNVDATLPRKLVSTTSTLLIDPKTPATVQKLSTSHSNGKYSAGELIELMVHFSKPITIQTGLNRNLRFHANRPVSIEHVGILYVFWIESATLLANVRESSLYMHAFSSETLAPLSLSPAQLAPLNRFANTLIRDVNVIVWNNNLYAAWDEQAMLYVNVFNGLNSTIPWSVTPNMGANRNGVNSIAETPHLVVHNQNLVLVWREEQKPDIPANTNVGVGQIRVAQRNDEIDAPFWIFHDGNNLAAGINRNPKMDAKDPYAVVFHNNLYITWVEWNNAKWRYEIIIARRVVNSGSTSAWRYLEGVTTVAIYESATYPILAVRRTGFEESDLLVSWESVSFTGMHEVLSGQVFENDTWIKWETTIPRILYEIDAIKLYQGTKRPILRQCGTALFGLWSGVYNGDQLLQLSKLEMQDDLFRGWKDALFNALITNKNSSVHDYFLVCLRSKGKMGILWTEFDGTSIKLRFNYETSHQIAIPANHFTLTNETAANNQLYWGEVASTLPCIQMDTSTTPTGMACLMTRSGRRAYNLTFVYLVTDDHFTEDLEVAGQDSFQLGNALLLDDYGNIPDLRLYPHNDDIRSLSYKYDIAIESSTPIIISVTSSKQAGIYGAGEEIEISVKFSAPVVVYRLSRNLSNEGSVPKLYLWPYTFNRITHNTRGVDDAAIYLRGSGSDELVFIYITKEGDFCNNLDYFDSNSLKMSEIDYQIRQSSTFPTVVANLILPLPGSPNSLSGTSNLALNTKQPSIVQLDSNATDSTYFPGDVIFIHVRFSLPVTVYGNPYIKLDTGLPSSRAVYVSGNNSLTLNFKYDVKIRDYCDKLKVVDSQSLILAHNSRILRMSTHPKTRANTELPAPGSENSLSSMNQIKIRSESPKVLELQSLTADGTYDLGKEIEISIKFSEKVNVIGVPTLALNIGGKHPRLALFHSGSGSNQLLFKYNIKEGDNTWQTPLDIVNERSLMLGQIVDGQQMVQSFSQILCASANPILRANLTLPRPGLAVLFGERRSLIGNNRKIYIRTDGLRVVNITSNISTGSILSPGHDIFIYVHFAASILVQGKPQLLLNAHPTISKYASYISGSGTPTLTFYYMTMTGDSCDLLSAQALVLNGGLITDVNFMYVPLDLGTPDSPIQLAGKYNISISSIPPNVNLVYSNLPDGEYGAGDTFSIMLRFDRPVVISDYNLPYPKLKLNMGNAEAVYTSGSGSQILEFTYTIRTNDTTGSMMYLDIADTSALVMAIGQSIFAASTSPRLVVSYDLPATDGSLSSTSKIRINTNVPTVISAKVVECSGTYRLGDILHIIIKFTFRVIVVQESGCKLQLSLPGSTSDAFATYVDGSTTNTLVFKYIVTYGNQFKRLSYASRDSLHCNILQYSMKPILTARTVLPLPGTVNSLGGMSSHICIEWNAPCILSVETNLPNGKYGAGQAIDLLLVFSEKVIVNLLDGYVFAIRLSVVRNTGKNEIEVETPIAIYESGSGTNILKFIYISNKGDVAAPVELAGVDFIATKDVAPSENPFVVTRNFVVGAESNHEARLKLPAPGSYGSFSERHDIHIDALDCPQVISIRSPNNDGTYTLGDEIYIIVQFSAPVFVDGAIILRLNVINTLSPESAEATLISGNETAHLTFKYTIRDGDYVHKLDYHGCPYIDRKPSSSLSWSKEYNWQSLVRCEPTSNALILVGKDSSIKRLATFPTTPVKLDLPEVSEWPAATIPTFTHDRDAPGLQPADDQMPADYAQSQLTIFFMIYKDKSLYIFSNGLPNHEYSDKVIAQSYILKLPRFPTFGKHVHVDGKIVGMLLNGVPIRYSATAGTNLDKCGGRVTSDGAYEYVAFPACYVLSKESFFQESLRSYPIIRIGYALDGFAIFYSFSTDYRQRLELDACNGWTNADGMYGYFLVDATNDISPYMPCLRGISTSASLDTYSRKIDNSFLLEIPEHSQARYRYFVSSGLSNDIYNSAAWINPSEVSVVYETEYLVVHSTGIPHGRAGPFPNEYNPNRINTQGYVFRIPRYPELCREKACSTDLPMDVPIGVMLNGIPFYSFKSLKYGADVMEGVDTSIMLFDSCHGLVDETGKYRYYGIPTCLIEEIEGQEYKQSHRSSLIGFALDGFPVFGPLQSNGEIPSNLDECNGRFTDDGSYRYHVTTQPPYTIGCYRGILPTSSKKTNKMHSLSYSHSISIETDIPHVDKVFSSKHTGIYTAGEMLDFSLHWSHPVVINTERGRPILVTPNLLNYPVYDEHRSTRMVSVFVFTISVSDLQADTLEFGKQASIDLNGATIRRLAVEPTIDADTSLQSAKLSTTALNSEIISKISVTLKGLSHIHASDLKISLFHEQSSAIVLNRCCRNSAFGYPNIVSTDRLITSHADIPEGVGTDYSFDDYTSSQTLSKNLVAVIRSSSTSNLCSSSMVMKGMEDQRSPENVLCAESKEKYKLAWLDVKLKRQVRIGTIRLWLPEKMKQKDIVYELEISSMDNLKVIDGYITLGITQSNGNIISTSHISWNAVAMKADENEMDTALGTGFGESMESKLQTLPDLPQLYITRTPPFGVSQSHNSILWSITFLNFGAHTNYEYQLTIIQNMINGGSGYAKISSFTIEPNQENLNNIENEIETYPQKLEISSMFPLWILLYDEHASMAYNTSSQAINNAIWSKQVYTEPSSTNDRRNIITIIPLIDAATRYVRLMTSQPSSKIFLKKIEVFETEIHLLSQYSGGSPIAEISYPSTIPWAPEEPLETLFMDTSVDGIWTLSIQDMVSMTHKTNETNKLEEQHGKGSISDWEIKFNTIFGSFFSYSMDLIARVDTIPLHGVLCASIADTENEHIDHNQDSTVDALEVQKYLIQYQQGYLELPLERQHQLKMQLLEHYNVYNMFELLGFASDVPSMELAEYGIAPHLKYCYSDCSSSRKDEKSAISKLLLQGKRTLKYIPRRGFVGLDGFTYTIFLDNQQSLSVGAIDIFVRECRDKLCYEEDKFAKYQRVIV